MIIDRFCLSCGQSTLDTPCPYCGSGVFKTTTNNALLDIENLASRFHQVYEEELKRQGKKSKYSYFFHELPKDIADLDRALAKFVIEFVVPICQKDILENAIKQLEKKDRLYHWIDYGMELAQGKISEGIVDDSTKAPSNVDGMSCAYVWNEAIKEVETKLRKLTENL